MTIALFVESEAGFIDELPAKNQTLIFAYRGEVQTYHRTSNGSKGRGQTWEVGAGNFTTPLTTNPVACVVTDRDIELVSVGTITNIAVKALYANDSATTVTAHMAHNEAVDSLIERLAKGDKSLLSLLTSQRIPEGVDVPLLIKQDVHVTPTAQPMAQAPETVQTTVSAPAMTMNLVTVPDSKWAKQYVNRRIDGVLDWDIYDHALANGLNVLIEGGAGSGKTISVQAYASARQYRYFNVANNNGLDPSQLFGKWIPNPSGQGYIWQDGAVTQLFRYGGVLLLNEVNFLPVRVSTVLFSALDYRREIQLLDNGGEVIKAHPNLLIVADMNAGYRGTQQLNQAFSDRFDIKLEFPYDKDIENKVVNNKALLTLAYQLRAKYETEELSTPISTRGLVSFIHNARKFGIDFAITSYVNGFNREERNGVRLACETHKANIQDSLGLSRVIDPMKAEVIS